MRRLLVLGAALAIGLAGACTRGTPSAAPTTSGATSGTPSASAGPSQSPTASPAGSPTPTHSPTPTSGSTPSPTGGPSPTHPPTPSPTPAGLPQDLVGVEWSRIPTSQRVVALTFDAGANADGVPKTLAALRAAGVPGTFFLTGKWVQLYPAYARQIGSLYPVGNHTYSHPDLTTLTDSEVRSQISTGASLVASATGRDTHPLFRFPFGASNGHLIGIANSMGYGCFRWTVDTLGWEGASGGQTVASVIQRVIAGLQPGEIVIMHVGSHPTDHSTLDADALPQVIQQIRARGYSFVTLEQFA